MGLVTKLASPPRELSSFCCLLCERGLPPTAPVSRLDWILWVVQRDLLAAATTKVPVASAGVSPCGPADETAGTTEFGSQTTACIRQTMASSLGTP